VITLHAAFAVTLSPLLAQLHTALGVTLSPLLAQAADPIPLWVVAPSAVMLAFVVLTAPIWPYSRGWGWSVAGMAAVGLGVAIMFSLAWILS
jgi:hypothetical protein